MIERKQLPNAPSHEEAMVDPSEDVLINALCERVTNEVNLRPVIVFAGKESQELA